MESREMIKPSETTPKTFEDFCIFRLCLFLLQPRHVVFKTSIITFGTGGSVNISIAIRLYGAGVE